MYRLLSIAWARRFTRITYAFTAYNTDVRASHCLVHLYPSLRFIFHQMEWMSRDNAWNMYLPFFVSFNSDLISLFLHLLCIHFFYFTVISNILVIRVSLDYLPFLPHLVHTKIINYTGTLSSQFAFRIRFSFSFILSFFHYRIILFLCPEPIVFFSLLRLLLKLVYLFAKHWKCVNVNTVSEKTERKLIWIHLTVGPPVLSTYF